MTIQPAGFLEPWFLALNSQSGIRLRIIGDLDRGKAKLYRARKESLDPRLDSLSIIPSPTASDELWIVHSKPKENSSGS